MNLLKTTPTSAAVRAPAMRREVEQHAKQQMQQQGDRDQPQGEGMMPVLRDKVSNVLDSSMILSPQWLGNVAANYMPARPPAFVPVIVQKVRRKKGAPAAAATEKQQQQPTVDDNENGAATAAERDGADDDKNLAPAASAVVAPDEDVVIVQPSIDLPAVTTHSLPSLEIAAPARNLCLELLSTRIVAVVRTVSLLLQEFSSSPGQSLPHVALIGSGNVGHTILAHLVRLLPPDRIVALARDEKSDTCMHFASKFGVRSLSTNILRDERLVDVVRSHRKERTASDAAASGAGHRAVDRTRDFGGDAGAGGAAAASHVAPEVAAAHNISVALQQVHVLIVACRPSQLGEVASSLQPWLRSSAVTVVSALAGVSADRVAALFRVPSSISATVDTNEMLFSFASASFLNARMATDSAITAAAAAAAQQQLLEAAAAASSVRAASEFGDGGAAASSNHRGEGAANNNGGKNKTSGVPFRFFAKDPMDFLHRLFFALVTTLLERCGVQPSAAWVGAAKLLLGRPLLSPPVVGAQGPGLVAKCSVQHLAAASGLSVGEVLSTVDARLASFAGVVAQ